VTSLHTEAGVDEALQVDLWTLRPYRDRLVAAGAPAEAWYVYRAWRARVMERAGESPEMADACS
jgi:hypothetical protein